MIWYGYQIYLGEKPLSGLCQPKLFYLNFQNNWGHCVGRQTQWRNFLCCQISSSLLFKAYRDGALTTSDVPAVHDSNSCLSSSLLPSSFIIFYLSSTSDEDHVSKPLVFLIVLYVSSYRWVNFSKALLFKKQKQHPPPTHDPPPPKKGGGGGGSKWHDGQSRAAVEDIQFRRISHEECR